MVDEICESNVVQVVTDNEPTSKAADQLLKEQRKHLLWSSCAAHCVELMIEDIGKMKTVKPTLNKQAT